MANVLSWIYWGKGGGQDSPPGNCLDLLCNCSRVGCQSHCIQNKSDQGMNLQNKEEEKKLFLCCSLSSLMAVETFTTTGTAIKKITFFCGFPYILV